MKVLIYLAGATIGPSVGIHLEEAIKQIKQGNGVFILHCDSSIGGCMENPNWNPLYCKLCTAFQKKDVHTYLPDNVEQHFMKEYVRQLDETKIPRFQYNNARELRNLTFHGVDIGLGAMSTYISLTRNLNPRIDDKSRPYFDALLREQVVTALVFERLQEQHHFELVVFQNGRGAQFKSLLNICQKRGIDYLCTEFKVNAVGKGFICNFFNETPHGIDANNKEYAKCWDGATCSKEEREKIARSFFENRRHAIYAGDKIYAKDQKQGLLPEGWNDEVENIVIFNSSEDEFAAVSKEFDDAAFFPSQMEGIKAIVEHYIHDKSKHFTLRVHPNLMKIPYKYHQDLYKLKYPNLTVVRADSSVSTYSLMDKADKIIVFGSTTGLEAVYWGKSVICLAAAYYLPMDIAYVPKALDDLWGYIDAKELPCKYNNQVLKYGYYVMSNDHVNTQYVNIDVKTMNFMGRKIKCYSFQKWLGSNMLYVLLMRGFAKLFLHKFPAKFKKVPLIEN